MDALAESPRVADGQGLAAEALFDTLYAELHRLARRELNRRGRPVAGLGVTTVLHEAYLRMSGRDEAMFPDHARFLGYAARVMRGLIIDDLRRNRSQKRGGLFELTTLTTNHGDGLAEPRALLRIGDAVEELARIDPGLAEIVDLKFFCGFSFTDIAVMRGVSERTIQRNWEKARLFLHHAMADADRPAARPHVVDQP